MHAVRSARVPEGMPKQITMGISILVLTCFFLSGLTGLIYEILWTRMIVKVIGSAPFAVSIILTVFMGGLGLGSFLASRTIDRIQTPSRLLRIYALLELAIGFYGIILPGIIILSKPLYGFLYNELFHYFLIYSVFTLLGCVVLLIFPAICMGATLPILCRFYVEQLGHLGTRAGLLYALNTIGAAMGSLLCGFWLITLFGVWGTLLSAVLLNGAIGVGCLIVSFLMGTPSGKQSELPDSAGSQAHMQNGTPNEPPSYNTGYTLGALFIFAVSGFCAMAYEVIWTRLLGLIIGPTTYSFTLVLATFIIGLGLGSLIFGRLADKTEKPLWLLLYTQITAALLVLGMSQLLGNSQFFFAKLIYYYKAEFGQLATAKAVILFCIMLGPTLCLGATFPLVGKIYTRSVSRIGQSIGSAYAINTLGAVLGSFSAGFLLIPWFGKEQSLSMVIAFQLLTALGVGGVLWRQKKRGFVRFGFLGIPSLVGVLLCMAIPHWDRQLLSMGRYHRFEDFSAELQSSSWLEALWAGPSKQAKYQANTELEYYGDGIGGFTTVMKMMDVFGKPEYLLINSGKGDASTRGDMPTQTLLAHLPLLLHPDPREVLVVGLASGVTAGEVLHYPIDKLDIVEISDQVVTGSDFFIPWNNNVLSNPKTELIIQDARAHLELTNRMYDVIIAEPSNPWMAGLANLFTKEAFLLARKRLNENGIFVQMFHSYQMDWFTFALVGRTFSTVFPDSILAVTYPGAPGTIRGSNDYLMVGIKGKRRLLFEGADKRSVFTEQSRNIVLPDPRLLARLVVSEDLQTLFGPGPLHTDNNPLLEFSAPKQMYKNDSSIEDNIMSKGWLSQETQAILEQVSDVEGQISFSAFAFSIFQPFNNMVALQKATSSQKDRFYNLVENYCARTPVNNYALFADDLLREKCVTLQIDAMQDNLHDLSDKTTVYNRLGNAYDMLGEIDKAVASYEKALADNPHPEGVYYNLGMAFSKKGDLDRAIEYYKKALDLKPDYAEARNNLGYAYLKKGFVEMAIQEFADALSVDPTLPEAYNNLGNAYIKKGDLGKAIAKYEQAIVVNPRFASAYYNLGVAYRRKGQLDKAIAMLKEAVVFDPDYAKAHYQLGIAYYYDKQKNLARIHCNKAEELGFRVDPKLLELLKPTG
jgi:spermidine synthase